ncbi:secretion system protein [Sphingomonas sp. Leaf339]|uniref:type II and III secretion system protein family protein n=1 Tax=Sphingomonas sp. Leaf339 TaxID=1736343 RepID=UPI000700BF9A|nr:type II and III secretion system protein family protein [Sphingomonas sp. Leaf339]KQU62221.1 secretion system protein [Sphingomonas sp. Leaf339]
MRVSMKVLGKPLGGTLCLALAMPTMPVAAQTMPVMATAAPTLAPVVQVNTGRGRLVTLARPMSDLFIADDSIADVQVRSPTQLYIFGKKTGETTISATARGGAVVFTTTVRVGNNLDSVASMLALAMPDAKVVTTPMNGMMLLTGTVATPGDAAEAERLVQAFVGDGMKVLSHLRTATPLQVNLQVRIAEVSRSFVKNIGVNLATRDTTGGFQFGISGGRSPGTFAAAGAGVSASGFTNGSQRSTIGMAGKLLGLDILSAIDLGETIGQVTTLANPNLTALSGETSTFLAGGEIPIPISQGLGAVSVEFKQYGISLAYTPTVLSDGRINLRVRPEVSQLSSAGAVQINGTTIPALTSRRAETTVELGSGQSLVIGGLMSNTQQNSIEKTPGLGDIPILGSLFRSNGWQRNETELVIVITPYLVKPVDSPGDIALPTDGYKAPTDIDRILLGKLSNGQTGGQRPVPMMAPPVQSPPPAGTTAGGTDPVTAPARKPRAGAPAPGFTQ